MSPRILPNLYRYVVDSLTVAGAGAVTTRYTLTAGVVIDNSGGGGLALGETSTTAYRGDRGKTAYDHSQLVTGNPHAVTAAQVGADPAGTAAAAVAALSTVYQPLDSDLTAIAALSTTPYGRAFLALADAAAGRTALGLGTAAVVDTGTGNSNAILGNDSRLTDARLPSVAPWRIEILAWTAQPGTVTGSYTRTVDGSCLGNGYANTASTANQGWTWSVLLGAGTWELMVMHRQGASNGIADWTLGATSIGAMDNYAASVTRNTVTTFSGISVASTGVYSLAFTNTSKNPASSNYTIALQAIHLRRTA